MLAHVFHALRLLPVKSQCGTTSKEKECYKPLYSSPRNHVCKTPGLNLATSGFKLAASSAVISTSRIFTGSIIASIQSLAAPYRGSACASYDDLISSYSAFFSASESTFPPRSICFARTSAKVFAAEAPLITAYRAVGQANKNRG